MWSRPFLYIPVKQEQENIHGSIWNSLKLHEIEILFEMWAGRNRTKNYTWDWITWETFSLCEHVLLYDTRMTPNKDWWRKTDWITDWTEAIVCTLFCRKAALPSIMMSSPHKTVLFINTDTLLWFISSVMNCIDSVCIGHQLFQRKSTSACENWQSTSMTLQNPNKSQ